MFITTEKIREFESFKSLDELNKQIDFVIENIELKQNERDVLLLLSRYSVKFLGVSFLKVGTIADQLLLSVRTVQRALKRLQELQVIKRLKRFRVKSGGFSSSLTIIMSHVDLAQRKDEEKPSGTRFESESEATETISQLISNSLKDNYVHETDRSYIEGTVDSWFITLTAPFFNNKFTKKLWKKAQQCFEWYSSLSYYIDEETVTRAFRVSVYAYKVRKIKDFTAYFFSTLRNMVQDIESELSAQVRRQAVTSGAVVFYDWLNE
ncbi:helix-turn-helix domain-containing protein [Metabacillus arenae]|uniref:Helix-turn-helix domain-containing protein n=1 Tax=Metabacillus arenae TaxID=2771434 RepID=A0A926RZ28_9BACI|nr:helix-turn-helix domain-containing protein [Metabacillus arenae]MBD1383598.1 helix-turn-helix domain-containing protein [Metabacillus arenae]